MIKLIATISVMCAINMVSLAMAKPNNALVLAVIVAQEQNAADLKLSPEKLSLIYWRKQRYWPQGLPIKPTNLSTAHPARLLFSKTILGNTPDKQIDYWNSQYFNGIRPPYSVKSEEAVLRYVSQTKGAIGYINACSLDKRVKPLLWITHKHISTTAPLSMHCQ